MPELGVTLDGIAHLRESRGSGVSSPVFAALLAEQAGAAAINVQLRGDRLHVQEKDVHQLRETTSVELNLVMTPRQEMIRYALTAKPDRVTFVPERAEATGAGGGLDVILNSSQLKDRVREVRESSILPAIHVDPALEQIKAAHQIGALAVDLSSESYSAALGAIGLARDQKAIDEELSRISDCCRLADKLGMHVGISRGLTLSNVPPLLSIASLQRVSVGHALVARAVMVGMERAVSDWMERLGGAPGRN